MKPEDLIVVNHSFKELTSIGINENIYRCLHCNVNSSWSKLVHVK
jgi:hypothetical protein